jgi:hypothetical protein
MPTDAANGTSVQTLQTLYQSASPESLAAFELVLDSGTYSPFYQRLGRYAVAVQDALNSHTAWVEIAQGDVITDGTFWSNAGFDASSVAQLFRVPGAWIWRVQVVWLAPAIKWQLNTYP